MVSSLASLVKLGGLGASLAFIVLSFYLLRQEAKRDRPRTSILVSVFVFALFSCVLFFAGTVAEVAGGISPEARNELVLRVMTFLMPERTYIKKFVTDTNFVHNAPSTIGVGDETANLAHGFIDASQESDYSFLVGVRTSKERDPMEGSYPFVFGPYHMTYQGAITIPKDDSEKLGCAAQVTIFRVPENFHYDGSSFSPAEHHGEVVGFSSVTDSGRCGIQG